MNTYISLLRGINVSGSKMITMDALKKIYQDAGFKSINTYLQSGNVIFRSKKTLPKKLEGIITKAIYNQTKFEVPVVVKELDEWRLVLGNNPFLSKRKENINFLHVTFLSDTPSKENIAKIIGEYFPDEFEIEGKNIYLFTPNGYGRTKLHNNFFENKLKLSATTRNWKTIAALNELAEGFK